jgi:hypothetical protein
MKLLILNAFLICSFLFSKTWWESPKIIESCNKVTIFWQYPPQTDFENPIGYLIINGSNYDLEYKGDGIYEVETNINYGVIEKGFVLTDNGEWLGLLDTPYTIKCDKIYLPLIGEN